MKSLVRNLGVIVPVTVLALGVAMAGAAGAQQAAPAKPLDVTAPPTVPPRPELGLEPTMPPDQRGAREQDFYPGYELKSLHEPAFVTPFVGTVPTSRTSGVRMGLSGWTASGIPFDIPQAAGGVAIGLTFMWSVPVAEKPAPAPGAPGQR